MAVSARAAVASGSVLIAIQYFPLINYHFGALSIQHHYCANLLILFFVSTPLSIYLTNLIAISKKKICCDHVVVRELVYLSEP